ncbi:FAD-binding protein [Roseivirga sp. BDSF3-8]|uniref:FAD-binding protein n=1 Tax=Roseivirga sp. BDSF3-8 TaxID=3241598 RepID=UPI00353243ED
MSLQEVSNWGNYPKMEAEVKTFSEVSEAEAYLSGTKVPVIPRGNGRCYGDASLEEHILSTLRYDKLLEFDREQGILECQSGITLDQVLEVVVPSGWFVPVTPGTKFITVGGAIASDVHGKNHHAEGCFADHVLEMDVLTGTGELITCGPSFQQELFEATRGGMGLTGLITRVHFKLKPVRSSYIYQKQIKARNLDEAFDLFQEYKDYTYSVSWIDCFQTGKDLGRSILMVGEHAELEELSASQKRDPLKVHDKRLLTMPVYLPGMALNPLSIRSFNFLYYLKNTKKLQEGTVDYNGFFYPLDAILEWNKMYGRKGFVQYQFVLPMETSRKGLEDILNRINAKGLGSFLAVLKLFGKQDNLISFPMEGYTLALDFPVRDGLFPFLDELDKVVHDLGGRLYLSKDARMSKEAFLQGYPRAEEFIRLVKKYNPQNTYNSIQAKRLGITT